MPEPTAQPATAARKESRLRERLPRWLRTTGACCVYALETVLACLPRYRGRSSGSATRASTLRAHLPRSTVAALKLHLAGARCYLEFGCGGSTLLARDAGCPLIISVDSSRRWITQVAREVTDHRGRFIPLYIDLGPLGLWGAPATSWRIRTWGEYCRKPLEVLCEQGATPDLVLIDGRFRVASFLTALLVCRPGARILFDDYGDRPAYHVIEAVVAITHRHERTAEIVVHEQLDRMRCMELLLAHTHVYR